MKQQHSLAAYNQGFKFRFNESGTYPSKFYPNSMDALTSSVSRSYDRKKKTIEDGARNESGDNIINKTTLASIPVSRSEVQIKENIYIDYSNAWRSPKSGNSSFSQARKITVYENIVEQADNNGSQSLSSSHSCDTGEEAETRTPVRSVVSRPLRDDNAYQRSSAESVIVSAVKNMMIYENRVTEKPNTDTEKNCSDETQENEVPDSRKGSQGLGYYDYPKEWRGEVEVFENSAIPRGNSFGHHDMVIEENVSEYLTKLDSSFTPDLADKVYIWLRRNNFIQHSSRHDSGCYIYPRNHEILNSPSFRKQFFIWMKSRAVPVEDGELQGLPSDTLDVNDVDYDSFYQRHAALHETSFLSAIIEEIRKSEICNMDTGKPFVEAASNCFPLYDSCNAISDKIRISLGGVAGSNADSNLEEVSSEGLRGESPTEAYFSTGLFRTNNGSQAVVSNILNPRKKIPTSVCLKKLLLKGGLPTDEMVFANVPLEAWHLCKDLLCNFASIHSLQAMELPVRDLLKSSFLAVQLPGPLLWYNSAIVNIFKHHAKLGYKPQLFDACLLEDHKSLHSDWILSKAVVDLNRNQRVVILIGLLHDDESFCFSFTRGVDNIISHFAEGPKGLHSSVVYYEAFLLPHLQSIAIMLMVFSYRKSLMRPSVASEWTQYREANKSLTKNRITYKNRSSFTESVYRIRIFKQISNNFFWPKASEKFRVIGMTCNVDMFIKKFKFFKNDNILRKRKQEIIDKSETVVRNHGLKEKKLYELEKVTVEEFDMLETGFRDIGEISEPMRLDDLTSAIFIMESSVHDGKKSVEAEKYGEVEKEGGVSEIEGRVREVDLNEIKVGQLVDIWERVQLESAHLGIAIKNVNMEGEKTVFDDYDSAQNKYCNVKQERGSHEIERLMIADDLNSIDIGNSRETKELMEVNDVKASVISKGICVQEENKEVGYKVEIEKTYNVRVAVIDMMGRRIAVGDNAGDMDLQCIECKKSKESASFPSSMLMKESNLHYEKDVFEDKVQNARGKCRVSEGRPLVSEVGITRDVYRNVKELEGMKRPMILDDFSPCRITKECNAKDGTWHTEGEAGAEIEIHAEKKEERAHEIKSELAERGGISGRGPVVLREMKGLIELGSFESNKLAVINSLTDTKADMEDKLDVDKKYSKMKEAPCEMEGMFAEFDVSGMHLKVMGERRKLIGLNRSCLKIIKKEHELKDEVGVVEHGVGVEEANYNVANAVERCEIEQAIVEAGDISDMGLKDAGKVRGFTDLEGTVTEESQTEIESQIFGNEVFNEVKEEEGMYGIESRARKVLDMNEINVNSRTEAPLSIDLNGVKPRSTQDQQRVEAEGEEAANKEYSAEIPKNHEMRVCSSFAEVDAMTGCVSRAVSEKGNSQSRLSNCFSRSDNGKDSELYVPDGHSRIYIDALNQPGLRVAGPDLQGCSLDRCGLSNFLGTKIDSSEFKVVQHVTPRHHVITPKYFGIKNLASKLQF